MRGCLYNLRILPCFQLEPSSRWFEVIGEIERSITIGNFEGALYFALRGVSKPTQFKLQTATLAERT